MRAWVRGGLQDRTKRLPGITAPRSRALLALTGLSLLLTAAETGSLLSPPKPLLLWNASASMAPGLYVVRSPASLRAGDIVVAWAPPSARRLAAARGYRPYGVPLVKRAAGLAGDRVCATRQRIAVNGVAAAIRRARDPAGRPMPSWSGCARLRSDEVFLLSTGSSPYAFDGRYFGVTRASELIGKGRLLWARPARGSARG